VKVQVLYFDGCPHYLPTVEQVIETLRAQGVDAEVERVAVTTPEQAQSIAFLGSPSVRINGLDVEREARTLKGYGFGCRTYFDGGRRTGLPSRDMIQRAIEEAADGLHLQVESARKQETRLREECCGGKHTTSAFSLDSPDRGSGSGALLAGGLSAILASTCCLGPLVLVSLGFSGAWIGNLTRLEPYRPYFLIGSVVALAFAASRIFRPAGACKPGEVCALPKTRYLYKLLFGITVLLVLVAFAFPYVARFFY
jgi:mercuric ion transport protein